MLRSSLGLALAWIAALGCGGPATATTATTPVPPTATPKPADAKPAPSAGWDGKYATIDLGLNTDSHLECSIGDPLTIEGGKLRFVVKISAVDTTVERSAPSTPLDVEVTVKADGRFNEDITLPPRVLAQLKGHKGTLARMTGVRAAGVFAFVDSAKEGTGKIGSVAVGTLGVPKGEAIACGFGLERDDYKSPAPSANPGTDDEPRGGVNKCRPAGAECNGNSNCCSSKCVGKAGHSQCR